MICNLCRHGDHGGREVRWPTRRNPCSRPPLMNGRTHTGLTDHGSTDQSATNDGSSIARDEAHAKQPDIATVRSTAL
jgi:hypothetical protein